MEIRVVGDPAADAARWLNRRARDAVRRRGTAAIALSGGSTAPALIAALDLPWDAVAIWQVDERVAPDGHPARNSQQLTGLPCRVHAMPVTASDLRAAARRYAAALPERFDVVHLGLGADGHTASWPPGRPEPIGSGRAVELVAEFNGWPRMTVTGRVVNAARSRLVVARGADKRPTVTRWLSGDATLPISAVRRIATVVFLDQAAAPGTPHGAQ